jgi:CarD family transcriptional regulator
VATKKTPANKKKATASAAKKPDATNKAATKKPAAKKAAVKKPAAKKAATKKPAAKKVAAKTPAAKTPAAKKPAGKKKAAPPKKAAAKKPAAKKAAPVRTKAGIKKSVGVIPVKKAPPKKSPFHVGDKVVYPHHGAATIVKRERIEFAGEKQEYFVLEIVTDQLTLRVPVANAIDRGVRPVISKNKARQVFAVFKAEPQEAGANWSRWYKLLTEKINSGDIFQVAEVVRDLTYAQQIKGISPALKRMLSKARLIIVSELQFSLNLSEEDTIVKLDRALPKVEEPVGT